LYACEPAVTQYLSTHWPQYMSHVLAVDTQQTWMLMKDAGRPLRELLLAADTRSNRACLEQIFARYAQFQIETAAYTDTLLMLGCPDRRLHMLPLLFEQVIADPSILRMEQKGGISRALTWYQVVSPLEDKMKWEYEDVVPYWLRMFLTNTDPDA
jgi:hypothetical protein